MQETLGDNIKNKLIENIIRNVAKIGWTLR
jgi:hypothetical protein